MRNLMVSGNKALYSIFQNKNLKNKIHDQKVLKFLWSNIESCNYLDEKFKILLFIFFFNFYSPFF